LKLGKKPGPELEAIRRRKLREIDTQTALINLADAFESCRLHFPPSPHVRTGGTASVVQKIKKMNGVFFKPLFL
jgi:hypothetical protein